MKDFRSHEVIAAVCEKYDLKIVFCDKRPKGWVVTNIDPKVLAKYIVKVAKHMLPKVRCCRAPTHCPHTHCCSRHVLRMPHALTTRTVLQFKLTVKVKPDKMIKLSSKTGGEG